MIANNTIEGNSAVNGAGIYISKTYYYPECSPNITHNVIQNNDASRQQGGGISVNFASPTINNNIIRENIAENGGGIHIDHSFCTIAHNDISGNSAPCGGAIWMTVSDGSIVNNRVVDNAASHEVGGIFMWGSSPIMVSNTIANNSAPTGGGIYCEAESSPTIFNTILWGNGDDLFSCSATYSDIEDGDPGAGNICADSMFVDPANGDYHLQSTQGSYHGGAWTPDANTSPCIDAGDPTSPYDNEPKPNGNRINMGAYGNTAQASKSPTATLDLLQIKANPYENAFN